MGRTAAVILYGNYNILLDDYNGKYHNVRTNFSHPARFPCSHGQQKADPVLHLLNRILLSFRIVVIAL